MASGTAKVFWVIWRQRVGVVCGQPEPPWKMHSDCYQAVSASFALAQWCRASYINAEVLAVLRGDFAARLAGGLGEGIAENGTRGAADAGDGTCGNGGAK